MFFINVSLSLALYTVHEILPVLSPMTQKNRFPSSLSKSQRDLLLRLLLPQLDYVAFLNVVGFI